MFLASGVSLATHVESCGSLASVLMSSVWDIDRGYDSFPVDGTQWLKVAGEIAEAEGTTDAERACIWR